jgi:hypothetical protein
MSRRILALTCPLVIILAFFIPAAGEYPAAGQAQLAVTHFVPRNDHALARLASSPWYLKDDRAWAFKEPDLLSARGASKPVETHYANFKIQNTRFGETIFNASMFSFAALNFADYFTTREALKNSAVREVNPLLQNIVKDPAQHALVKLGITALSYWNMKSLYKKNKPLAWLFSIASNALMYYVVSNNIQTINESARRTAMSSAVFGPRR